LYGKYVDVKFAPSDLAAKYTFGEKAYESGKVTLLHNAVDLDVFHFDANGGKVVRQELGISEDALLVGHVGRFMTQKNHGFLLEIFCEIAAIKPDARLLLVGKGELEQNLREQAERLGIVDKVIFAGVRSDIPQILSAMDVLVFPSLYEGMPNTVIEAQATGLPCVIADTITREADITGLVQHLPLDLDAKEWAESAIAAVGPRHDTRGKFTKAGYDIENTVKAFLRLVFGSVT
jgi:glycosyltransferase involved in cell wall biosynthesis